MTDYVEFNEEDFGRWLSDNGDSIHRLNYDLNESSIVFDLGGYKGEWAENIFQKYKSKIYVFEPVFEFYKGIKDKFNSNSNIFSFCYGLGPRDESVDISLTSDSSSVFNTEGKKETIQFKEFAKFIDEHNINNIDLMKVNIEGGEYELLEYLMHKDLFFIFKNIQVQFHRFIPECAERRNKIRECLSKTHELTYDYEFIWENWKLK